jgi:hypothetical protein
MKNLISIFIFCCMTACLAETNSPIRDANLARVEKNLKTNQKKYDGKENFFVRRGILADRKKQIVMIQAEAADVTADSIIEFFLIDETSGHDYESLAIAFTKPSDVRAALEFIGMKAGRTIDIRKHIFWVKGERVIMHIDGKRSERYVCDEDESAPESGMVFTGGIMIPSREDTNAMVYAADVREPSSMASNYNERDTVLDVPRRAPQKTVYGHNMLNPGMPMKAGRFIEITLEPEYKEGRKRVLDLVLQIKNRGQKSEVRSQQEEVVCRMSNKDYTIEELITYFRGLLENGQDPFVTLKFDDDLSLKSIKSFCTIIATLDTNDGIRVEPPAKGHLYYQAYNPPERFLNRKERINQPLELFLEKKDGVLSGVLTKYIPTWPEDSMLPDLEEEIFPVKSPQELRETLDTIDSAIPAVLVHAPADSTHGEVMGFIGIGLSSHPLMHIFIGNGQQATGNSDL